MTTTPERPLRVVLVTTHYPPLVGGAATYFSLLAAELQRTNVDVTVLTTKADLKAHGREGFSGPVRRRIPVLDRLPASLRRLIQAGWTFWELLKLLYGRGIDVVHTHSSKSVTVGAAMFSSFFRIRIVYDVQDFLFRRNLIRRGFSPRYLATGTAIGKELRDLGIAESEILVIPSIPPDEMRAPMSRKTLGKPVRGLFVGELHREVKGEDVLLRAVGELRQAAVQFQLDLIGEGPDRKLDESLGRELGIQNAIEFRGPMDYAQLREEIENFDMLIVSSRTEGMPRIILEAFARGVPVIATKVGGIPAVINDNGNGLLVPAEDPSALAASIRRLVSDPDLWVRLRNAGRDYIDRLPDWSEMTDSIVVHYQSGR